uniref:PLAT domain-containing protein n=1 Tax=Oryzias latipes TaxID=8090 RepID=A0A3P9IYX7_ORYLA
MKVGYQVTVSTKDVAFAAIKKVYITLVGQDGSSKPVKLKCKFHKEMQVESIGVCLLQIQLKKQGGIIIIDSWLPAKVEVESPDGKVYTFPIYHWLTDSNKHFFREGAGLFLSHALCCPHAVLQNDLTCFWAFLLCSQLCWTSRRRILR